VCGRFAFVDFSETRNRPLCRRTGLIF